MKKDTAWHLKAIYTDELEGWWLMFKDTKVKQIAWQRGEEFAQKMVDQLNALFSQNNLH